MVPEGRTLHGFAVTVVAVAVERAAKKRRHVGAAQSHVMTCGLRVSSLVSQASVASLATAGLAILVASNAMMSSVPVGLPSRLR